MTFRSLAWGTLALGAVAAGYAFVVRPWHLRWGAPSWRADGPLPGDALFPERPAVSTRAVTIDAPPAAVWPWLVQIGQGRGGFYSYDALENLLGLDIHSVDEILPGLQHLEVGDVIGSAPPPSRPGASRPGWRVVAVEPERLLALDGWGAFVLKPLAGGRTRLLVRTRPAPPTSLGERLANRLLIEPAHFVMERKMLLGLKTRAERTARREPAPPMRATAS